MSKLEKLQELDEETLTQKIVMPLFKKLGYEQVQYNHGSGEHGKDVVFHETNPVGVKKWGAAQVKSGKVRGGGTTQGNVAEIKNQIQEAFDNPYQDNLSGEEFRISEFYVITSKGITNTAQQSINNSFTDKDVYFMTGENLLEKMEEESILIPELRDSEEIEDVTTDVDEFLEEIKEKNSEDVSELTHEGSIAISALQEIEGKIARATNDQIKNEYSPYYEYLSSVLLESSHKDTLDQAIQTTSHLMKDRRIPSSHLDIIVTRMISTEEFENQVQQSPEIIDILIDVFSASNSYNTATSRARWLMRIRSLLNENHVAQIARATAGNDQIYGSYSAQNRLGTFFIGKKRMIPDRIWDELVDKGVV
jgi:hypothetical protein